jgi:hypothetical protein
MIDQKQPVDVFLIVQSIIAIILVATLCVMLLAGTAIPDLLIGVTGVVIGFYFGTRTGASSIRQSAQAVRAVMEAVGS